MPELHARVSENGGIVNTLAVMPANQTVFSLTELWFIDMGTLSKSTRFHQKKKKKKQKKNKNEASLVAQQ